MVAQKNEVVKQDKRLLELFGKVPKLDVKGFDRQRRDEIKREDNRKTT